MRLGILGSAYACDDLLPKTLPVWLELKKELDIKISISSCLFEGFEVCNNNKTEEILTKAPIDCLYVGGTKQHSEAEARNFALNHLLEIKCDNILLWDSDEKFSGEEVKKLIKFINEEPLSAWFSIEFKNLTFSEKTYTKGFCPPRVFRTKFGDCTLKEFYYDNDVFYVRNGEKLSYKELPEQKVPVNVCNPLHFSWLDNERSRKKVEYQTRRWGNGNGCSFKWENKLEWNDDYFRKTGLPKPELFTL